MVIYTIWNKKQNKYYLASTSLDTFKAQKMMDEISLTYGEHHCHKLNEDYIYDGLNHFEIIVLDVIPKNSKKSIRKKSIKFWVNKLNPFYGYYKR